jgi:hypothetical protein
MVPLVACSLLLAVQPPADGQPAEKPELYTLYRRAVVLADRPDDLATALANHPDVQIAEAEVRLAQARLAKARQAVAQGIAAAQSKVATAKAGVGTAEQALKAAEAELLQLEMSKKRVEQLHQAKTGAIASAGEVEAAGMKVQFGQAGIAAHRHQLEAAKAALAAAEAELRAAAGGGQFPVQQRFEAIAPFLSGRGLPVQAPVPPQPPQSLPGPAADKLLSQLRQSHGMDFPADTTLHAAAEALGTAAADKLVIRTPGYFSNVGGKHFAPPPAVGPLKGTRPIGEWLQLVADAFTESVNNLPGSPNRYAGRYDFFVRDYGLLFCRQTESPAGAMTVGEFARRAAAEEASRKAVAKDTAEAQAKPLSPEVLAKVKAALGKPVKLPAMTGQTPRVVYQAIMTGAGLDLAVEEQAYPEDARLTVEPAERSLAAWFEMLLDRLNDGQTGPDFRPVVCVREYGLLVTRAARVPPGAVPLSQLK